MEIIELALFDEAFKKDQYNLTFDPELSVVNGLFSTSLRWVVHNDFVSFDLGETVFEYTNCIGFLKA